jgi:hypothetical protein
MFVDYKHIFVNFWPTNISLFPVVQSSYKTENQLQTPASLRGSNHDAQQIYSNYIYITH